MATPKDSPIERVQKSFRQLSIVAPTLNSASDKLGKSVSKFEARLKSLALGVSSWVAFTNTHSPDGFSYYIEEIGYTRNSDGWGLSIRTRDGNQADPDDITEWTFNEAPRHLRVRAVKKLPDLLDKLIRDATSMAKSVSETADEVDQLADALEESDEIELNLDEEEA